MQALEILSNIFTQSSIVPFDLTQPSVILSNPHYLTVVKNPFASKSVSLSEPCDSSILENFSYSSSILITSFPPGRLGNSASGYNLTISKDLLLPLWEKLQAHSLYNITFLEWHALHTCFGIPLFPFDYPDTPSGMVCTSHSYVPPYTMINQESITNHPKYAIVNTTQNALRNQVPHFIFRSMFLFPIERISSVVRAMLPNRRNEYKYESN